MDSKTVQDYDFFNWKLEHIRIKSYTGSVIKQRRLLSAVYKQKLSFCVVGSIKKIFLAKYEELQVYIPNQISISNSSFFTLNVCTLDSITRELE